MNEIPFWVVPLTLPMPSMLGAVNVYLIKGPAGFGLIDTGMNDLASRKALHSCLAEVDVRLEQIETVIVTHGHADHCGLGKTFIDAGAKVLMSEYDAATIDVLFSHPQRDEQRATFFGRHSVPKEFEVRVTRMFPFFRKLQEKFTPSDLFKDGDVVNLGGIDLTVMLTPGHTPGHVCFVNRETGVVFTGDHIISEDATHVSMQSEIRGSDPLGGFVKSLKKVGDLGKFTGLPGHGKPIWDISVRADQLVRHHRARIDRVKRSLDDTPQTAYDLSLKVFGDRKKVFAKWLAMSQILAYLEHLCVIGEAEEVNGKDGVEFKSCSF